MLSLPGLLCGGGGGSEGGRDGGRGCISLCFASGEVLHKATFEADLRLRAEADCGGCGGGGVNEGGGSEGGREEERERVSLGLASSEVLHKATFEAGFMLRAGVGCEGFRGLEVGVNTGVRGEGGGMLPPGLGLPSVILLGAIYGALCGGFCAVDSGVGERGREGGRALSSSSLLAASPQASGELFFLFFVHLMSVLGVFRLLFASPPPHLEATPTPWLCWCWGCPQPSCWTSASKG